MTAHRRHVGALALGIVLAVLSCVLLCGCNKISSSSKKKDTQQNVQVVQAQCEASESASLPTGGTKVDIPDEFDSIQSNAGIYGNYDTLAPGFSTASNQYKAYQMWIAQGSKFQHALPVINGRYGVVMKEAFGEAGDYVDIVYKDKTVLHAYLVDIKGTENASDAWAEYGHTVGSSECNVLELYVHNGDISGYNSVPGKESGMEYVTGTIDYVVNYGSMFDNPDATAPSSESTSNGSSVSQNSTSNSSVKIVGHKDWTSAKQDPTGDFPLDSYKQYGTHDGSTADASGIQIDTTYQNDDGFGHGTMGDVKYIVLHSTESGTYGCRGDYEEEARKVINGWIPCPSDVQPENHDRDGVAAHFVVSRSGKIYQIVDMSLIAWSCGPSSNDLKGNFPDIEDADGLNAHSISIEICNDVGDDETHTAVEHYPEAQLEAVDKLIAYIKSHVTTVSNTDANTSQCSTDDGSSTNVPSDADSLQFKQTDARWASHAFANTTIGPAGCGLCALTSCIDILLGQTYTPDQVSDKLRETYSNVDSYSAGTMSSPSTATAGAAAFGLTAVASTDTQKLKQALVDGKCIWLGAGGNDYINVEGENTAHNGHCVMFYKFADGKYYCHDSVYDQYTTYTEEQFKALIAASTHYSGTYIISKS